MIQNSFLARADALLRSRDELLRGGTSPRQITDQLGTGSLVRLRRGWYADRAALEAVPPEVQHLASMLTAQRTSRTKTVFGHRSAATAHGLPVWSPWLHRVGHPELQNARPPAPGSRAVPTPGLPKTSPSELQVTDHLVPLGFRASRSPYARYRQAELPPDDVTEVAGFSVTSPERTLFDLARDEPFPVALACADQYLRHTLRAGPHVDMGRWWDWQALFAKRLDRAPRVPGITFARALLALADPRSDSPLESVSRLRLVQLGIDVEPQFAVRSERGGTYYTDFWFTDSPFFGECDGKAKYTDSSLHGGRRVDEIVYREKRREDWIVGSTRRRCVRWGAADVMTTEAFARRLRTFGVPVPGTPSHRLRPETAAVLRRLR